VKKVEIIQFIKEQNKRIWTIDELNNAIVPTSKINLIYKTKKPFYEMTDNELEFTIAGIKEYKPEKFKVFPFDPKIKVSNYGRVNFNGILQKQIDINKLAGYLYLADYKELMVKSANFNGAEYVYNIIAETWLEKPPEETNLIVHHISNDGYDNRPENLIYITRELHAKINHKTAE